MKKILIGSVAAAAMMGGAAFAGGIERGHSPYTILWEKGNYAELSFGRVMPKVKGSYGYQPAPGYPTFPLKSGNMLKDYTQASIAVKYALRPDLDLAVVLDQPMGVDIGYPRGIQDGSVAAYPLAGSNATIDSNALSALLRYRIDENWSVHGGLKLQRTKGRVHIESPTALARIGGSYDMKTSSETDLGYIIGGAYERPDIAMRVALTYQSAIKHDFKSVESAPLLGSRNTGFRVETPQQLTLDFQTGVAADTLVFGSLRWREWSAFNISPPVYGALGSSDPQNPRNSLVAYPRNVMTYTLGVGRKFTENFSGSVAIGYEKSNGFRTSNLGPHNGLKSVTLGGAYTQNNMKISGGVTYAEIGDATTYAPLNGSFKKNHTVGVGVKVGFSF